MKKKKNNPDFEDHRKSISFDIKKNPFNWIWLTQHFVKLVLSVHLKRFEKKTHML